ncbi:MAG: hypothetical protein FWH43_01800, partial [Endomicrobia bacterium]|nr:hypothetical protein [Endomicrobiia bacterium]
TSAAVLLFAVGAMILFFGTRLGMTDPYKGNAAVLKKHGFPVTSFTKTLATIDIEQYASVLNLENFEMDVPFNEGLFKVALNDYKNPAKGLAQMVLDLKKAAEKEDRKIKMSELVNKIGEDELNRFVEKVQKQTAKNNKDFLKSLGLMAVGIGAAVLAFIAPIPTLIVLVTFGIAYPYASKYGKMLGAYIAKVQNGMGNVIFGVNPIMFVAITAFALPLVFFGYFIFRGYNEQKNIIKDNKKKISDMRNEIIALNKAVKQTGDKKNEYMELLLASYTKPKADQLFNILEKILAADTEATGTKKEKLNEFASLYFQQAAAIQAVNDKLALANLNVSKFDKISEGSELNETYAALQQAFGNDIVAGLRADIEAYEAVAAAAYEGGLEAEVLPSVIETGTESAEESSVDFKQFVELVLSTITLGKAIEKWINDNIISGSKQNSIASGIQFFVENYSISLETRTQVLSMMKEDIGIKSVIMQRSERDSLPNDYDRIKPNTSVPVIYNGTVYYVTVEHYVPRSMEGNVEVFRLNPVIKCVVLNNAQLDSEVPESMREEMYNQAYILSAKHFAADINGNVQKLQRNLGVSGAGMIVYKGVSLDNKLLQDNGITVEDISDSGIFELRDGKIAQYFDKDGLIREKTGELLAEISARKERGKNWQMPGNEYGGIVDTERSPRFTDASSTAKYTDNEQSKNISLLRVVNADIKTAIEVLYSQIIERSAESSGKELSSVVRIRNILNTGNNVKKIADLKLSDLINNDGSVNADLIRKAYLIGFKGIYADVTGLSSENAAKVIDAVKQISDRYGIDAQNYIIFDRNNSAKNASMISEFEASIAGSSITAVVTVEGESTAVDVERAVGRFSNIAVEMAGMDNGDELVSVQGRVVTAFMRDTTGVSKDKSRVKSSAGRYKTTYDRAFKTVAAGADDVYKYKYESEYILNGLDLNNIGLLRDFMTQKPDKGINFKGMTEALKAAGIREDSVAYKYAADMEETGTEESYASAKAYIRAAVEKYLEKEYAGMKGVDIGYYLDNVNVSDRKTIRSLMLYMAVNGQKLDSATISELLSVQKLAMSGEERKISELLAEAGSLINEILSDPLSVSPEKMDEAKRAFTLVNDSMSGFAVAKMINNVKNGTKISASTVRSMLQAA